MPKSKFCFSLILSVFAALTPAAQAAIKPGACHLQDISPAVNGVTLHQIARSIEADKPPLRIKSGRLLNVGSKIDPRQKLKPVTAELVKALPEYSGYAYFLTKAYAVIVHPPTRRIAYLMPFCPISQ